jgi:DNA-directed RNA polymerase alpha subunit
MPIDITKIDVAGLTAELNTNEAKIRDLQQRRIEIITTLTQIGATIQATLVRHTSLVHSTPIEDLVDDAHLLKTLGAASITFVEDLQVLTEADVGKIPNLASNHMVILKKALGLRGLAFRAVSNGGI